MRGVGVLAGAAVLVVLALIGTLGITTAGERFPHDVHSEAELDCETCHDVAESQDLSVSLLPTPEICEDCHDPEDLETWGMTQFDRPEPRFAGFGHATHSGADCSTCHGTVDHPWEMRAMAGHDVCFGCHDAAKADDACESCHSQPLESLPAGTWWGLALQQSSHHSPGYLHRHQYDAFLDGGECGSCHREDLLCSTCHHGENVEYAVHERVWRFTHSQEAIKNLQDCQACHEMEGFCTECHASQGIRPGDHAMSGWVLGQNLHGPAARRDLAYCAGCHESDQSTCGLSTACHKDDNVQGNQYGQNIHPAGFRDDVGHGPWHEDDGSSCFECHELSSRDTGIGFCTYCHGMK